MDQATLVGSQFEDGQKLLDELSKRQIDVRGACWIRGGEDEPWYLYIVMPLVDQKGLRAAYAIVHPVIDQLPAPSWLAPLDVRLIGPSDPLARPIEALQQAGNVPSRFGGANFGGMEVESAFVYPRK